MHKCLPASVVRYYEENWHHIKEEWVRYWQQQNLTFGERTTNRLESINKRIKAVVQLLSPLPIFFRDLLAVKDCMRRERNHAFIKSNERIPIKLANQSSVEREFSNVLTPFSSDLVLKEFNAYININVIWANGIPKTEILVIWKQLMK